MKDQNRVTALAVVTPKTTALCVPQAPTSWNWSKPAAAAVAVGPLQGETPKAKKTARAGNPFHNLRLNKDYPHAEVTFTIEKGIEAKATFNFTEHPGRLSRGTVALLDPDTGYLMQKDAESKAHDFATAVKADLIVIAPTGKQNPAEVMEAAARKAANKLYDKYRGRIYGRLREQRALAKISLGQALELYGSDYLADRSTSADLRKTYGNRLHNIANFLGEKHIEELKRRDLKRFGELQKNDGTDYIDELFRFLQETAYRLGVEMPAKDVLESCLKSIKGNDRATEIQRKQCGVANSDVLPEKYEKILDAGCWEHLGDPRWAATVMIKEGGLPVKAVCALRIKDVYFVDENADEVYIAYRRDDLAAYTHDYTFPLTPFGGRYMYKWLDYLRGSAPEERTRKEKHLFSQDELGEVPLDASDLTRFVRTELSRYVFGYAGRIQLEGKIIIPGVRLLIDTREKHIREDCRFDGDRGAISFLLHQSLSRQVQSDHYRCFVDETGRRYLFKHLSQIRHGLPEEAIKHTRASSVRRGAVVEYRLPPKTTDVGTDELITLSIEGLNAGDVIEVMAAEGCYITVRTVE